MYVFVLRFYYFGSFWRVFVAYKVLALGVGCEGSYGGEFG